jgi:AraC-like DNA-binding protein
VPLDIRLKPVESLLFRSDVIAVGKFRCPASHPLFRDSGPCSHHTFVFPRTMTQIRHDDGRTFLGSPSSVALYNQDQRYSRMRVSDVDASDWYTLADDVLLDMTARYGEADPRRPFEAVEVRCDDGTFLEQRLLFDALDRGDEIDATQVEETMLGLLERLVAHANGREVARVRVNVDAIEHVRMLIARDPSANTPLRVLARAAELSTFHLCRLFRAHTGETITRYRHSLRLRLALDRLRDRRADLTTIAADHGFASHSHFTSVFRNHFGLMPSAFRART